ncbi:MAG: hypothetical protein J5933_04875 [Clostridia bacterium]|nr:hypothetical protein [Clostridia bacterium]
MFKEIFPFSFRVHSVTKLITVLLAYLFFPIFIGLVGSTAYAVPYISAVLVLLTVLVCVYCVGGIATAILYYCGIIR